MEPPIVTILGRQNVGKSTFFNAIVKGQSKALTSHLPGTTRDWREGQVVWKGRMLILRDTAGEPVLLVAGNQSDRFTHNELSLAVKGAIDRATKDAAILLLMVDYSAGITSLDEALARVVRASGIPWIVVVNKAEGPARIELAPFYKLGGAVVSVSASRKIGIDRVLNILAAKVGSKKKTSSPRPLGAKRITISGRSNVGKSTLVNALLGRERTVVSPVRGTTRDPVETHTSVAPGVVFTLVDTPGIGRRASASTDLQKQTAQRAYEELRRANAVLVVLDATEGPTRGDAHVAALAKELKKPFLTVYTKKDLLEQESMEEELIQKVNRRFPFLHKAPVVFVSGKTGENIELLKKEISSLLKPVGQ